MADSAVIIDKVSKAYHMLGSYFGRKSAHVHAVRDVSLSIPHGSVFGLVGESGSGKSTLARLLVALEMPSAGSVTVLGKRLDHCGRRELRELRSDIQIIYQDPYSALDPLMTVGRSVEEPLLNLTSLNESDRREKLLRVFDDVELPHRLMNAYPHQLSGGERQRACIARALILRPRIVVCDEPVSSLDKSIQAQIVRLFKELQRKHDLTYFFITHDLAIVNNLCDRVAVMYQGRIVEQGNAEDIIFRAQHTYTRSLIGAARFFTLKHSAPA